MRLLVFTIMTALWLTGGEPVQACNSPCAPSGPPSWRFLIYPFVAAVAVYIWRWWFVPPAGVAFDPDDPEKLAAEREAQRTLPVFWQAFENPALDEQDFAVKFNLTPHKDAEFIWAYELRRNNGVLHGKLANEPLEPGYEPDRFYPIDEKLIVDWTFSKGKEAKGHFITRAMMNRMPKRFVNKARKEMGWSPA
jgi:uncharacterized protein YegJ (DUF2314 family)